jgi:hypothetical protein
VSSERILDELRAGTHAHPLWAELTDALGDPSVGVHLAVMVEPFLGYLFDGSKTIESRFSARRIAPYEQVATGDLVLLKAGPVVGCFGVSTVTFLTLRDGQLQQVRDQYAEQIRVLGDQFWLARAEKRYATLLGVDTVRRLPPLPVTKRDMRGWAVLRRVPPLPSGRRSLSRT